MIGAVPFERLKTRHKNTPPIGRYFDGSAAQPTNLLVTAVTMGVIPIVIVFVVLQRYLVKRIQLGALKG